MVYTLTLDSSSWLAALTGESSITVCTNGNLEEIARTTLAVDDAARFKGFLFKVNGALVLFADEHTGARGGSTDPTDCGVKLN